MPELLKSLSFLASSATHNLETSAVSISFLSRYFVSINSANSLSSIKESSGRISLRNASNLLFSLKTPKKMAFLS